MAARCGLVLSVAVIVASAAAVSLQPGADQMRVTDPHMLHARHARHTRSLRRHTPDTHQLYRHSFHSGGGSSVRRKRVVGRDPFSWAVTPSSNNQQGPALTGAGVGTSVGPVEGTVDSLGVAESARGSGGALGGGQNLDGEQGLRAVELKRKNTLKIKDKKMDTTQGFFSKMFGSRFNDDTPFEPLFPVNDTAPFEFVNTRQMYDLFHAELPVQIHGTRFILIDRLQPPTIPKFRTDPATIRPQLIKGQDSESVVISGKYTSSLSKSISGKTNHYRNRNRVENNVQARQSIVPKPIKVEGSLDLENFFSPFRYSSSTSAPFQLDSFADYYYDYDYTDYPLNETSVDHFDPAPEVNLITLTNNGHSSSSRTNLAPKTKSTSANEQFSPPPPVQGEEITVLTISSTTPSLLQTTTKAPSTPLPTLPEVGRIISHRPPPRLHSSSSSAQSDESRSLEHQSNEGDANNEEDSYEKDD